jgi:thioredoxin reductase (NADPH)
MEHTTLAIIGSGPAGLTAAVYAARANLRPTVIEGTQAGGQLTGTTDVENYPGFPEGILGPELMQRFRSQAERFGASFLRGDVRRLELGARPFGVVLEEGGELTCDALILSTGATPRMLGLPNERRLVGHGVSTCATCDGFFFRGRDIVVVGGGDSAIEEGTFLTRFATKVHLVHRRAELRASKIMRDRALANPKMEFHWNSVVDEILESDGAVRGVVLRDVATGKKTELAVHGVFVAIGHVPNTALVAGTIDLDENGYVALNGRGTMTNVEGVFACGDVADHVYRQAVTAAGTGCQAAIDAERWLEARRHAA